MSLKGRKFTDDHKRKIGLANSVSLKGRKLPQDVREKIGKAHTGLKYKKWSLESRQRLSDAQKGKKRPWCSGDKSNLWKGGKTKESLKIRTSLEYRLWRNSVFIRDNYTCVWCGVRGGKLNADHIKPFCDYPEIRLALDNGRTLCEDCHRKTDTFCGKGRNKKAKIVE